MLDPKENKEPKTPSKAEGEVGDRNDSQSRPPTPSKAEGEVEDVEESLNRQEKQQQKK